MSISSHTLLLVLLALVHGSIQKSTPESPTYRAAVVEFKPEQYYNDSERTLNDNTKKIVEYIELAAKKNVDIVLLPELSLTGLNLIDRSNVMSRSTLIPDPFQNYSPCTNVTIAVFEGLRRIACTADQNDIYVGVNLLEKEMCSPSDKDCPSDGVFLYVTTVIFDREGKIISRYRKSNLVDEHGKVSSKRVPEISTFDTDFGVTFGNIICFDIMFEEPWLRLTTKLNVTDIIYPAGWFSEMPFLNTIQMQAGWAYIEDVNLLAPGDNDVLEGYSGSGIYAGRQGIISSVLLFDHQEALLVADVPKKSNKHGTTPAFQNNQENQLDLKNLYNERLVFNRTNQKGDSLRFKWVYDKLDMYESRVIDSNGYIEQSLNHSEIDCEFQVNVTDLSPPETYRLLAFDYLRPWGNWTSLGVKICAIVHCSNDTIDSCGRVEDSSTTFNSIAIKATYVDKPRVTLMPSTLGSDMLPLDNWTFDQDKQGGQVHTTISSTAPIQNLITFGIFGRDFERDTFRMDSATVGTNLWKLG